MFDQVSFHKQTLHILVHCAQYSNWNFAARKWWTQFETQQKNIPWDEF